MDGLKNLKKAIQERKTAEKTMSKKPQTDEFKSIDLEQVESIVSKMRKRYSEEGLEFEEVSGRLKELRGIIAEGQHAELELKSIEDIQTVASPLNFQIGKIYLKFKEPLSKIVKYFSKFSQTRLLSYYLYSANMRYTIGQYLALSVTATAIITIITAILSVILLGLFAPKYIFIFPTIIIMTFVFSTAVSFLIPRQRARSRGTEIDRELPFALRHIATELKAGVGLYRTLQTIAVADYGVLAEEFAKTINEIEEGTDTKIALKHLALRTQSKNLRKALLHVIRALKTGGNLSSAMETIAENVSFDLRIKMREFSEKMNFFGVIFLFIAIVLPVFVAILGGISNSPLGMGGQNFMSGILEPQMIAIIYLVLMPLIFVFLISYIKMIEPKM
ncbi:MAG: type II secretion system F family protein [archaeon]